MSDITGISYVPRLCASVLRMSASAEARHLKSGGSGVDFSVPVIVLMVVLSALSTILAWWENPHVDAAYSAAE